MGKAEGGRGHVVAVTLQDGASATGFITATGSALQPTIIVSSKARLRQEIAMALRAFGGATRLTAPPLDLVTRPAPSFRRADQGVAAARL